MADRYLEQGPEAKPRNYLADMVRDYGLYGLSDKLNSSTSGVGMLVDAVGGLGNALFVQPAQSFNRLMSMGYESGNPQSAEDAFNVAGAAMVGGLAAPRPRGSIGMSGRPEGAALNASGEKQRLYHGSQNRFDPAAIEPRQGAHDTKQVWLTPQREYAETYGNVRQYDADLGRQLVADKNVMNTAISELQQLYPNLRYSLMGDGPMPFHGDAVTHVLNKAQREGYDSVRFPQLQADNGAVNVPNGLHDQIAVFDTSRLKPFLDDGSGGGVFANGGRPGAAVGAAANAAAERPGIRAYHGSPHDFDRFDMSKIGTGEGAQAYGHGLYFAENEGVARSYRNDLSGPSYYKGRQISEDPLDSPAAFIANKIKQGKTFDEAFKMAQRDFDSALNKYRNTEKDFKHPGHMYEVRINASPDDFLDWDKPLSQQSEKVRGALRQYGIRDGYQVLTNKGRSEIFPTLDEAAAAGPRLGSTGIAKTDPLGSNILKSRQLVPGEYADKAAATARLREAGIPGIKYLDQGSRTQGEGSRNYVVFDDNLIEILRKYGLLGMIGGGAVAGGLQSDQNKQTDWARKMQPGDA